MTSGVGLEPEQDWENPPMKASPYGTDPTLASISFAPGHPAGSASPLTWAQAQLARLALGDGRPLEQPAITRARYVEAPPPGTAPLSATLSTSGTLLTVTGRTTPGAIKSWLTRMPRGPAPSHTYTGAVQCPRITRTR
jgi:glucoamylase